MLGSRFLVPFLSTEWQHLFTMSQLWHSRWRYKPPARQALDVWFTSKLQSSERFNNDTTPQNRNHCKL
jgi:hypothetical protein